DRLQAKLVAHGGGDVGLSHGIGVLGVLTEDVDADAAAADRPTADARAHAGARRGATGRASQAGAREAQVGRQGGVVLQGDVAQARAGEATDARPRPAAAGEARAEARTADAGVVAQADAGA